MKLMLRLEEDWKLILRHAWSFKFNALASVAGTVELLVQSGFLGDGIPKATFGAIALVSSLIAMYARLLAQKELTNGNPPDES